MINFFFLLSGLDLSDSDSGSQPAALTTEDVQSHIKGSLSFGLPKKVVSVSFKDQNCNIHLICNYMIEEFYVIKRF